MLGKAKQGGLEVMFSCDDTCMLSIMRGNRMCRSCNKQNPRSLRANCRHPANKEDCPPSLPGRGSRIASRSSILACPVEQAVFFVSHTAPPKAWSQVVKASLDLVPMAN